MHPSVQENVPTFLRRFEGLVTHLYLDGKRLVTTGLGNLVDDRTARPPAGVLALEWVRLADGQRASREEVAQAWLTVHRDRTLNPAGGGVAYADLTGIRLTRAALDGLILSELARFAAAMRGHFPSFDAWPADAQLGLLSMAWAMGAEFPRKPGPDGFPRFCAACRALDFATAAKECRMDEAGQNADFTKRNDANVLLFENAAAVVRDDLDRAPLYWPRAVPQTTATTIPPTELGPLLRREATRKAVADALAERDGDPDPAA